MTGATPFRWDLSRREQLGRLLQGPLPKYRITELDELRDCAARVVALAGDSDLVFLGRSPESLFDYLSGLLADSGWAERCVLLNLSMRYDTAEELARAQPERLRAAREHLAALGLTPAGIASGPRRTALVDLVSSAGTFGNVAGLLCGWAAETAPGAEAVRRRLRFVGITMREKNSPNTWRWYQRAPWAAGFPRGALCSVSISYELWSYLGNWQPKVSRWNPPASWGDAAAAEPPREEEHLEALRLAAYFHQAGREEAERERFAAALAARPEMKEPWLRRLVIDLRR